MAYPIARQGWASLNFEGNDRRRAAGDAIRVGGDARATPALVKDGAVTDSYSDVVTLYVEFVPKLPGRLSAMARKLVWSPARNDARGSLTAEHHRGFVLCSAGRRRAAGVQQRLCRGHRLSLPPQLEGLDPRWTDALIGQDESDVRATALVYIVRAEFDEWP